jgi:carboxypeptidase family protein
MFRQAAGLAALTGTLALGGCGQHHDRIADRPDASGTPPDGPFGHATITGIVRFVGATPANPPIDMRAAPRCRAIYHSTPRQLSAVVNPNGTLANVFVYVKRGLPTHSRYTPAADSLLLTQRGCQYHPRVFGMMVGQTLSFRNDDVVAHHLESAGVKTRPFTIPHPAGRRHHHAFRNAEVMVPLECDTHRWMRAYVGILPHPFFATTNRSGRFTIPRLPPGTYTLEAWHEGYGRRTTTLTVPDSTTRHVTFTYTPTPAEIS